MPHHRPPAFHSDRDRIRRSSDWRRGRARLSPKASRPRGLTFEALESRVVLADTPIISEFLAVNNTSITDENGDHSDWIEIHNPTDQLYSLFNWYLTDDAADLDKWRFPAIEIAPGGYLVVFASGKDRAAPGSNLHTNFRLDGEGEYLALVQADGTTVA